MFIHNVTKKKSEVGRYFERNRFKFTHRTSQKNPSSLIVQKKNGWNTSSVSLHVRTLKVPQPKKFKGHQPVSGS